MTNCHLNSELNDSENVSHTTVSIDETNRTLQAQSAKEAVIPNTRPTVNKTVKDYYHFPRSPRLILRRINNIREFKMDVLRQDVQTNAITDNDRTEKPKQQEQVFCK